MSIPYAQNIDVNQMQLIQPVIDKQASPASGYGIEGQIVYDSTGKKLGYHDGSSWIYLANNDGKQDRHGFENRTDSTRSFDDGDLEFTITGTFNIFNRGVKIQKTTESITIDNIVGLWYFYYNSSNVLTRSQTAWTIGTDIPVGLIYWNGTTGLPAEERHGLFDWATHDWAHKVFRTMFISGLSPTFTNTTFQIDNGLLHDEDIPLSIPTTTQARIFYRSGSNFTFTAKQTNYTQVGGSFQYDNAGTLTAVDNSKYFAVWVYGTNFDSDGIIFILGQRQDTTVNNARANNTPASLNLAGLAIPEMKLLYRVILQNSANPFVEYTDYRETPVTGSNILVTDHQTLSNRSAAEAHPGTSISLDASGFNGQLATTDDTVQKLAQKFDDLVVPSLPVGTDNQILRNNNGTWEATGIIKVDDGAGHNVYIENQGSVSNPNYSQLTIRNTTTGGTARLYLNGKNDIAQYFTVNSSNRYSIEVSSTDSYSLRFGNASYASVVKFSQTGAITSDSLTASTLLQSDANKGITSITNGTGYLKNNGSGTFSYDTPSFSLTNWTESNYTYNTKYGVKFTPLSAQTNVDAVIQPKGTGGFLLQQPDGTTTGGNNRGSSAIDLQFLRDAADQVASGNDSACLGTSNKSSGAKAISLGVSNVSSGLRSIAIGNGGTASGDDAITLGINNTSSHQGTIASGQYAVSKRKYETIYASLYKDTVGDVISGVKHFIKTTTVTEGASVQNSELLGADSDRFVLATNETVYFKANFVAKKKYSTHTTARTWYGAIRRGTGTPLLVSTQNVAMSNITNGGLNYPTFALSADTDNNSLKITFSVPAFTGNGGDWVCVCNLEYTSLTLPEVQP